MRLNAGLCTVALTLWSCAGDGETWSLGSGTGAFAALSECSCTLRDRLVVAPIGRFAIVQCLESPQGTIDLYLPMVRAERSLVQGFLDVEASTHGRLFAERVMGESFARFKGQPVEQKYRMLYVPKLRFESETTTPDGELTNLTIICDTYLVDDPGSAFFDPQFGEPSP